MMKRIADGVTWKIHLYNKHLRNYKEERDYELSNTAVDVSSGLS